VRALAILAAIFWAASCVDIQTDPGERPGKLGERDGPTVEFDPAQRVIPFPHDLLRESGKVFLPPQCGESQTAKTLRERVLNALDGFGLFKTALRVTLTDPVDPASLEGHVKLFRLAPATETEPREVPVVVIPGLASRAAADCSSETQVYSLTLVPSVPLREKSTYIAVILSGARTASGQAYLPSPTWALIRQTDDPVTFENGVVVSDRTPFDPSVAEDLVRLLGLDRLWHAHAPALSALDQMAGIPRDQILLAWTFTTQTVTAPLDAGQAGSPAASLPDRGLANLHSIALGDATALMVDRLGATSCAQVGCDHVGDVLAGDLIAPGYQIPTPNPLTGGRPVPGPWADPLAPMLIATQPIPVLAFVPRAPAGPRGYPVVVFGHGLGSSRQALFAIASQLASRGIASVAIDWVLHGDRAVRVSEDASIGCAGTPPATAAQCFSPFLSPNLAATRDNFRQSALDGLALIKALKRCVGDSCASLRVDSKRLGYLGQSLGSLIGGVLVGMSQDLRTAVLNTGGVGLVDLIENSKSLPIRCTVVDALIAQGIVNGTLSNLAAHPPTGTCLDDSWRTQPSYLFFANIARWVLDPADAANYAARLRGRQILVQKIRGDQVVPNVATDQLGRLLGANPVHADRGDVLRPPPSDALETGTNPAKLLVYTDWPANAAQGFPGNTYLHGSLLVPVDGAAGALATARLQADAIAFLAHKLSAP
jgi:hypothetical protein